ncbi:LPS export ABC transporter periplasmic protein LptC [Flavobacterium sp. Sd200]|uniref:LPS export ABC transporter periplasmic protein LptC n=1 Tax=Flavobacterium sp. Sd200 TaxID=2692211 RepID=UPI00136FA401|nr:LPS export ABC transporter periplasmic protein LptC [Flavobacterium sp. Sd200]MXN92217.1 LPS export ABC transporter periplasmic protein LptC [Flavobacterium sp. Sd200]
MIKFQKYIMLSVLAIIGLLTSCESNFKDVQRINSVAFSPVGRSENINLKYTDSGKVKAILVSPLMLDYSQLEYGFNEFPKGVDVTLIDNQQKNSYIKSDYAITYANTDIIDLQGNVKITSNDGKVLETDQLYYDQKNEWFYTEKYFKFTDGQGGFLEGPGIDFSKDFKIFNMQSNKGQINKVED